MNGLSEPLRPARIVGDPASYGSLGAFSCGPGEAAWERQVDRVVARLARGDAIPQTLFALEDGEGELVGVCSYWLGDLLTPLQRAPIKNVPYINIIGVDRRYQNLRLADGARPGDALLAGVLGELHALHGSTHVFALVAPENERAHALFERHGFGLVSPMNGGRQALRIRPPQPV